MIDRNKTTGSIAMLALTMVLGAGPVLAQTPSVVPGSPAASVLELEAQRARAAAIAGQGMTNTNTGSGQSGQQLGGGVQSAPTNSGAPGIPPSATGTTTTLSEAEARVRLAVAGYPQVTEMRVDERGMWRGRAIRDGAQVSFALDNQGNVSVIR